MNINFLTMLEKPSDHVALCFWSNILGSSWLNPINLNESQMTVCMDLFENLRFSSLFLFLSNYCGRLSYI